MNITSNFQDGSEKSKHKLRISSIQFNSKAITYRIRIEEINSIVEEKKKDLFKLMTTWNRTWMKPVKSFLDSFDKELKKTTVNIYDAEEIIKIMKREDLAFSTDLLRNDTDKVLSVRLFKCVLYGGCRDDDKGKHMQSIIVVLDFQRIMLTRNYVSNVEKRKLIWLATVNYNKFCVKSC